MITMITGTARTHKPSNGSMKAKSFPQQAKATGEQPPPQSYGRARGNYGERQSGQSNGRGRGKFGTQHSWRGRGNYSRNQAEQTCYVCHSVGHLSYKCPNRPSGGNDKGIEPYSG